MIDFKSTIMYKKGEIGERIVDKMLIEGDEWIPYSSIVNGSHPFDRLVARKDKKELMILDVKTIDCRDYYPDTGISISHFNEYKFLKNKYDIKILLCFVDSKLGKIYGNYLSILAKDRQITHKNKILNYPIIEKNFSAVGKSIIYFPLESMKDIYKITEEEIEILKSYSNKGYKKDMSHKSGYNEWSKKYKKAMLKIDGACND